MATSETRRSTTLLFAFAASAILALPNEGAAAPTRCVNPAGSGGCFATIQAAVDASSSRDTIAVAAGSYAEAVVIPPRKGKLTIVGDAAATTIIDATGLAIGIQVAEPGNDLTLSRLTVRGATQQGIHSDKRARLTLDEMIVAQNAIGVQPYGGRVTITRTTIADNPIFGIESGGNLHVEDSTLTGNGFSYSYGGAISFYRRATIVNSTLSGNSVGVRVDSYSTATIESTTITGNGGGLVLGYVNNPKARIRESILAGNGTADCVTDLNAKLFVAGTTLIGNPTCTYTVAGSATVLTGDPLLGPLADNGGPTETHALLAGSPALGAVSRRTRTTTDQRGEPRGLPRDLGSFEAP
jgi:hypothetical protein